MGSTVTSVLPGMLPRILETPNPTTRTMAQRCERNRRRRTGWGGGGWKRGWWCGVGWDGMGGGAAVEGSGNNNKKCEIKDPTLVAK